MLSLLLLTSLHEAISLANFLLGLCQILRSQIALYTNEFLNQRLILFEHLVVALGHGTTNNKRCTGIVNQHRVNLVDDGVVMGTLHEIGRRCGHIVTQVVETKLVVSTEGDVSLIGATTSFGVWLMLIDTVDTQTVELIERSHPFRVTLRQVIIDRHHVYTITGKSVQEHRQRSHQRFTLTRCHLGNLTLMKNGTTKELNVVVNHLPLQVVTACRPVVMIDGLVTVNRNEVLTGVCCQLTVKVRCGNNRLLVLGKTASRLFHDGKHLEHHFVEGFLVDFKGFLLQLVYLCEDRLTLIDGRLLDSSLQFLNLCFLFMGSLLYLLLNGLRTGTQFVVRQSLNLLRE